MTTVTGRVALAHSIARRLTTPTGQVSWWPQYGLDLRAFLAGKAPRSAIAAAAMVEIRKDERVQDADVTVSDLTPTQIRLDVTVTTTDADLLQWTLAIDAVSVTVEGLAAA